MVPHLNYIDPLSSYYYFRPYQAFHVREHQNEVATYGGDPRNPYANLLFRNLYAELEVAWQEEDAALLGSPFEDEIPHQNTNETDMQETPPVEPPAPNINTSTPAGRLKSAQQAKPINRSSAAQNSTATLPESQRRVFRVMQ